MVKSLLKGATGLNSEGCVLCGAKYNGRHQWAPLLPAEVSGKHLAPIRGAKGHFLAEAKSCTHKVGTKTSAERETYLHLNQPN